MVAILLGTGFEPLEAVAPVDILRRGGVEVKTVSISDRAAVQAAHGIEIKADYTLRKVSADDFEMVVIPGGLGGVNAILGSKEALDFIHTVYENGGYAAAICAGPTVLARLHITDGKRATCYPGMENQMGSAKMQGTQTAQDGRVLTGRAPGAAVDFGLLLLSVLRGKQAAEDVAVKMVTA